MHEGGKDSPNFITMVSDLLPFSKEKKIIVILQRIQLSSKWSIEDYKERN